MAKEKKTKESSARKAGPAKARVPRSKKAEMVTEKPQPKAKAKAVTAPSSKPATKKAQPTSPVKKKTAAKAAATAPSRTKTKTRTTSKATTKAQAAATKKTTPKAQVAEKKPGARKTLPPKPKPAVEEVTAESAFQDPRLRHEGQLQSERARFALSPHRKVIAEGLGTPPPGYGLTIVKGVVRDPRHVVAMWDINDTAAVQQAEAVGWDRLCLRALDEGNRILVQVLVGTRGGTYHLPLPYSGTTIRLAVGIERLDGYFLTLARSAPLRIPPEGPSGQVEPCQTMRLPVHLDRRHLLAGEPPPRPGQRGPLRFSAAWRLYQRVRLALQALPPEKAQLTARDLGWAWAGGAARAPLGGAAAALEGAAYQTGGGPEPGFAGPPEGLEPVTSPAGWTWSGPAPELPEIPSSPREWISSHLWTASGPVKEK